MKTHNNFHSLVKFDSATSATHGIALCGNWDRQVRLYARSWNLFSTYLWEFNIDWHPQVRITSSRVMRSMPRFPLTRFTQKVRLKQNFWRARRAWVSQMDFLGEQEGGDMAVKKHTGLKYMIEHIKCKTRWLKFWTPCSLNRQYEHGFLSTTRGGSHCRKIRLNFPRE